MPKMLLDYYKAIEEGSEKMLEAAKARDWDSVVRLEGGCAVLINQLRHQALNEQLDTADKQEKFGIMQRILNNDAQIRNLVEPWLDHFEQKFEGKRVLH